MADQQPAGFVQSAPRKSGLRIRLEAIDVVKTGRNAWKALLIATLIDNPKPTEDAEVQFYLGAEKIGSPVPVQKADGRSVKEISDLPKDKHFFYVHIVGTSIWERYELPIQEPRRDPRLRLEVTEPNRNGRATWEAVATAIVAEEQRPPFTDDVEVEFFLDGVSVGTLPVHDTQVTRKFSDLAAGERTFYAAIVGFPKERKPVVKPIKEPKRNLKLQLEVTEPNKTDDGTWGLVTTTIVTEEQRSPYDDDVEIQISHNGTIVVERLKIHGTRATHEFVVLTKGNHTFFASVVGHAQANDSVTKHIKEEKLSVRLELTEPNKRSDVWDMSGIVTVTRGSDPLENAKIQFYLNTRSVGSIIKTDSGGRVSYEFAGLGPGSYSVEAKIEGTGNGDLKMKILKEEKPKRPAKLAIEKSRQAPGDYFFAFQVLADDNAPIKGATIEVMDRGMTPPNTVLAPTDEQGTVRYRIQFTERRRPITAHVLGSDVRETINLFR